MVGMSFSNITDFSIGSANDSSGNISIVSTERLPTTRVHFPSTAGFLMCLLGIPGNMLVMAVYIQNMTTSTRVYLFALAVADSIACFAGIVLTKIATSVLTATLLLMSSRLSVFFSVFLLVYLSMDRLSAVLRPHTFTSRASRAKMALGVIAIVAAVCTTVVHVAYYLHFGHFARVFILCISLSGIFVMVICYVAMATTMIRNMKSAVHPNMEYHHRTKSSNSRNPTDSVSFVVPKEHEQTLEHHTTVFAPGKSKTFSKREKNVYKDLILLFTITFMFAACWIPLWLSFVIAHLPIKLRGSLIFNSAVNPIIYGVVSKMFRDDVRQFCSKIRSKLTTCSHRNL